MARAKASTKSRAGIMSETQMMEVQRELGEISATLRNADDNRHEMIRRLDVNNEKLEGLSNRIMNVEQSIQSQSHALSGLISKNYEIRLAKLEDQTKEIPAFMQDMRFWHRLVGGGVSGLWKVLIALVGSGLVGGGLVHYLHIN